MANILQYARGSEMQEAFDRANFMKNPNNYKQIGENLKKKVYDAKIHYYGSRIMGVGTNDSDIDIFIEVGEFLESQFVVEIINSIFTCLRKFLLPRITERCCRIIHQATTREDAFRSSLGDSNCQPSCSCAFHTRSVYNIRYAVRHYIQQWTRSSKHKNATTLIRHPTGSGKACNFYEEMVPLEKLCIQKLQRSFADIVLSATIWIFAIN